MRAARIALSAVLVLRAVTVFAQSLPPDANPSCTASIASWFVSGTVTINGAVNPADSVNLDISSNCHFYRWSEQMFLWMTSPAATYGGNGVVFQSPVFFAVDSCGTGGGELCFISQFSFPPVLSAEAQKKLPPLKNLKVAKQFSAALRPAKRGAHGLPVVHDRAGMPIEITDAQVSPSGKPLVAGPNGVVEVDKIVRTGTTKKVRFLDAAGKVIPQPRPVLSAALKKARAGQRFFLSDGTALIVDSNGVIFDVSPEQAGKIAAVLLTQSDQVVYYTVAVNDVYAWFVTGVANGAINTNNKFPTTAADLQQITNYAAQYGVTLSDANALTIEAKMSWVDASTLPNNAAGYITSPAMVPVYDESSTTSWPQTSTKPVTLALLGVHVAGSSRSHPEMIWATFEHVNNSPNAACQYVNTTGATVTVNQSTTGSWLLTKSGSSGPFNVPHANFVNAPALTAQHGQTISGSDTLRMHPFGVAPAGIPNQNNATPAIANTEVISLNNSVLSQLAPGDVRANYYFVGSTWTFGGFAPTRPYPVVIATPGADTHGAHVGTSYLANSTMESYQQAGSGSPGTNCFSCHKVGQGTAAPGTPATTEVSHIYPHLLPLFRTAAEAAPAAAKKKKSGGK